MRLFVIYGHCDNVQRMPTIVYSAFIMNTNLPLENLHNLFSERERERFQMNV